MKPFIGILFIVGVVGGAGYYLGGMEQAGPEPGSLHRAPAELADIAPIPEPVIVNFFNAPTIHPGDEVKDAFLRLVFDRNDRPAGMANLASMWTITLKPGGSNGPHAHGDEEQIYVCLEGEVEFTFGKERVYTLHPGDAVYLPKLYSHGLVNTSDADALVLAVGAYDVD